MAHAPILPLALSVSLAASAAGASCGPPPATTGFRDTLAAYYACDAAARVRVLGGAEAARCAHLYESVKTAFAPEGTSLDGYRAFKCWERAHPALVSALRRGEAWTGV